MVARQFATNFHLVPTLGSLVAVLTRLLINTCRVLDGRSFNHSASSIPSFRSRGVPKPSNSKSCRPLIGRRPTVENLIGINQQSPRP